MNKCPTCGHESLTADERDAKFAKLQRRRTHAATVLFLNRMEQAVERGARRGAAGEKP